MNLQEIKKAVDEGKTVHWVSKIYVVEKWPRNNSYEIVCKLNRSAIGLTHKDGVTMNGKEEEFFLGE